MGLCVICRDDGTGRELVCGERHVVGGIRSVGSFVGEGARVGPCGEVQVMLQCSKSCHSASSISFIVSMLVT